MSVNDQLSRQTNKQTNLFDLPNLIITGASTPTSMNHGLIKNGAISLLSVKLSVTKSVLQCLVV